MASMPPSPLLSARSTYTWYFSVTRMTKVQKIKDRTPRTLASVTATPWTPLKHSLMAYKGLVPMSP